MGVSGVVPNLPFPVQEHDLAHLIFFIALAVAAVFALVLLWLPPDKAQRIVRWVVRLMFGKKN